MRLKLKGSEGSIISLSLTLNEQFLVSGSTDEKIRVLSMSTGNEIKCYNDHLSPVICIFKTYDCFLTLSNYLTIGKLDINNSTLQISRFLNNYRVGSESFTLDDEIIGFGGGDSVIIWDLKNETEKV